MNCILLSSFDKLNYYCVLYGQTASRALFCIHDKKCRGARSSYVRNSVTAFDAVDARSSIPQNGNGLNVSSKYFIAQCIRRYTGLNSTAQSPVYFLWFVYRRRTDVGQYTYTRVFTRLVYIHIHINEGSRGSFGSGECGTMQLEVAVEKDMTDCTRSLYRPGQWHAYLFRPFATHLAALIAI